MKIIKNFSKNIIIFLHIVILTLLTIAIVNAFKNELFASDKNTYITYVTYSGYSPIYNLNGLIGFATSLINNSTINSQIKTLIDFNSQLLSNANILKFIIICIYVTLGILLLSQLFNYRLLLTFISLVITLVLFIVLKGFTINSFSSTKMIIDYTKEYSTTLTLLIIATSISFIQVAFNVFIKKVSINDK